MIYNHSHSSAVSVQRSHPPDLSLRKQTENDSYIRRSIQYLGTPILWIQSTLKKTRIHRNKLESYFAIPYAQTILLLEITIHSKEYHSQTFPSLSLLCFQAFQNSLRSLRVLSIPGLFSQQILTIVRDAMCNMSIKPKAYPLTTAQVAHHIASCQMEA